MLLYCTVYGFTNIFIIFRILNLYNFLKKYIEDECKMHFYRMLVIFMPTYLNIKTVNL